MKKFAYGAFAAVAALTLVACGKSDNASEAAQAENVEMPAEEAMGAVDEGAAPAADASGSSAAVAGAEAAASAPAADASAAAPGAAAAPAAGASAAVEAATKNAEKKM